MDAVSDEFAMKVFGLFSKVWMLIYYFAIGFFICLFFNGMLNASDDKAKFSKVIEKTRITFAKQK